jgi:hypothetical protein
MVRCAWCGEPMNVTEGIIHRHDGLPRHGHCRQCIELEAERFGPRQGEPRMHPYLAWRSMRAPQLQVAVKETLEYEGCKMSIVKTHFSLVTAYTESGEPLTLRQGPYCSDCEKPIQSPEHVMLTEGSSETHLHIRCFKRWVIRTSKTLRAYGKSGVRHR